MRSLSDFQEVLANGSIAEVKAVLRAYIGEIHIDSHKKSARVGFYRLPTRALGHTELEYEEVKLSGGEAREPNERVLSAGTACSTQLFAQGIPLPL